jgi:DNA-binding IclR family transcriptional regulator
MTASLTTKPSPSTTRAVGIINFLAEHPNQAFKLSDLQRALRLSRTTCHAILLALVEAGYVHRGADKSYRLGPALVEIGRAASASLSPLQVAQPEMRRLADRYDVICSAVFMEGSDMVVRDRAASVSHLGFSAPRGIRLPMTGDVSAAIQFAWARPAQFEAWFAGLNPPPSPSERAEMEEAIDFVREQRFAFGFIESEGGSGAWKRDEAGRPVYRYATSLDEAAEYQVAVLQSWVFDSRARVAFALTLTGMTQRLPAREIVERGRELRETCDRITASIGGRWPQRWDSTERARREAGQPAGV